MASSTGAVALPEIASRFDTTGSHAAWTVSLYILAVAVTTTAYGRVSDLLGVRRPLLVGFALVAVGVAVAASAQSFAVLMAGRVVQGLGAGAFPALAVAAIGRSYAPADRVRALARMTAVAAGVSCLGPLVGGVVTGAVGWRAVMALPLLSLAVLPLVWASLSTEGQPSRLDLVGALLTTLAAGSLVVLAQSVAGHVRAVGAGLLSTIVFFPALAVRVRARPDGFLPVAVITNGPVMRGAWAACAIHAAWFGFQVGVPIALVDEGWRPVEVGVLFVPGILVAVGGARHVGTRLPRADVRSLLVTASTASALGLVVTAVGLHLTHVPSLVAANALLTFSLVIGHPAMAARANSSAPSNMRGSAIGIASFLFMLGGSLGTAITAGLSGLIALPWALVVLAALPALAAILIGRESGTSGPDLGPALAARPRHRRDARAR